MQKEGQMRIATLDEFMEWTVQLNHRANLFRGVPKAEYEISAAAYRRVKQATGEENRDEYFEKFLQINRGLIGDVRLRGLDRKDGRELKDLEILAELQHFGAATCLVDFTYNAQVALWFACEQEPEKDGKVVAVQADKDGIRDLTLELLEKEIDYFFLGSECGMPPHLYKWQAPHQNNRIIAQQSVFLLGAVEIKPDVECFVDAGSKEQLRESLKQGYGITEEMLFPDFDGFARQHREDIPYTELTASQYRQRALQKIDSSEYEGAIADYTEAIKLNPGTSDDHVHRGNVMRMFLIQSGASDLQKYKIIINDYDEAIRLEPKAPVAYYQRGILWRGLGKLDLAVLDFDEAFRLCRHSGNESLISGIEQNIRDIREGLRTQSR